MTRWTKEKRSEMSAGTRLRVLCCKTGAEAAVASYRLSLVLLNQSINQSINQYSFITALQNAGQQPVKLSELRKYPRPLLILVLQY